MSSEPWITIIGLGEDGPDGLGSASRAALENAQIIMAPPRHLSLLPAGTARRVEWPVPFLDGLKILRGFAGQRVVVLASGDPFWFGAGAVIAEAFDDGDWTAIPAPSCFGWAAARLGWPLDKTLCLGLHAAPLGRLRPHLAPGQRMIVLLRDGDAVSDLARYLQQVGFNETSLTVLQALGGPRETVTTLTVSQAITGSFSHPVCVALDIRGDGAVLPCASGLSDDLFDTDGVMTKRPVRALTLSALAPRPGERLWDIGGGSGSIAIEWLLAHPACQATSLEPRADRIGLIRANAARLGVDRLNIVQGHAPDSLVGLDAPDAVFVGGGLSRDLLDWLGANLPEGTRLVINAVTLESEALLVQWQTERGGDLIRIALSQAHPIGGRRGWNAAYPVVQWSGTT